MTTFETLLLGVGISIDAFVVALALGLLKEEWTFSDVACFLMSMVVPALLFLWGGYVMGQEYFSEFILVPHGVLQIVIAWIGYGLISQDSNSNEEFSHSWSLSICSVCCLGVISSLDIGLVGLLLGIDKESLWPAIICCPMVTGILTLLGLVAGRWSQKVVGDHVEIIGGSFVMLLAAWSCF